MLKGHTETSVFTGIQDIIQTGFPWRVLIGGLKASRHEFQGVML